MYPNGYYNSRSGSSYYPVSNRTSGLSHPGSLYDDSVLHEMRHARYGPHSTGNRSTILDGDTSFSAMSRGYTDSRAPTHASSSRQTRFSDRSTLVEPSYASGPVRSRASTRQSTIYPDDSVSNHGPRSNRQRETEIRDRTRGRSRGPARDRRQLPLDIYPPTMPTDSAAADADGSC